MQLIFRKQQCGKDRIKEDMLIYMVNFAAAIQKKEENPEFIPRDVPDSCLETAVP